MFRQLIAVASAALITVTGCQNTDSWVEARAASSWSAQYGGADNSSYSPTSGSDALRLEWRRSVKGALAAQVVLGSAGYLAANAQTDGGCSLMLWEADNKARQRWCTRLVQGGGLSSPLFDGFDNVYIGQPGAMLSFPTTQWIRWRQPVIGMPTTPRILAPGQLLVVTHLGQVLVFDAQQGAVLGTPIDLVAGVDPADSGRGLADCGPAEPRCPVAAAPAFAATSSMVVLGLWEPNAEAPILVGMRYRPGQTPVLSREWRSTAVGGGPRGSPVLSADGKTVYVDGADGRLWALDATEGKPKWSVPLGFSAQSPPAVTPDGLLVVGSGPGAKLLAVRDRGTHGDIVWTRDDVAPLSTASLADGDVGYTIARQGQDGQTLEVFDLSDGRSLNSYPLPQARGVPLGVSIGHDRRVIAATSDGQVYGFAPA